MSESILIGILIGIAAWPAAILVWIVSGIALEKAHCWFKERAEAVRAREAQRETDTQ